MKTKREMPFYLGWDAYLKFEQYVREYYQYHRQLRRNKWMKRLSILFFGLYAVNFYAFCSEGMQGNWASAFFFLFLSLYFAGWGIKAILSIK